MWLRDECSNAANTTRRKLLELKRNSREGKKLAFCWLSLFCLAWVNLAVFHIRSRRFLFNVKEKMKHEKQEKLWKRWKEQRTQKNASALCVYLPQMMLYLWRQSNVRWKKAQSRDFRSMLNVMTESYNRFHILIPTNVRKIKTSLADVYGAVRIQGCEGSEGKELLIEVENNHRNVIGWESSSKTYGWDGFSELRSNASFDEMRSMQQVSD